MPEGRGTPAVNIMARRKIVDSDINTNEVTEEVVKVDVVTESTAPITTNEITEPVIEDKVEEVKEITHVVEEVKSEPKKKTKLVNITKEEEPKKVIEEKKSEAKKTNPTTIVSDNLTIFIAPTDNARCTKYSGAVDIVKECGNFIEVSYTQRGNAIKVTGFVRKSDINF